MGKDDYLLLKDNEGNVVKKMLPIVLLVNTKFDDGTFRNSTRIKDDAEVHLAGGEEFIVAYVDEKVLEESKS